MTEICHVSHPFSSLSARVELTRQNQQFGERKSYNEPIDRDDLRLKRSCRNEMASTDRDMILCDRE